MIIFVISADQYNFTIEIKNNANGKRITFNNVDIGFICKIIDETVDLDKYIELKCRGRFVDELKLNITTAKFL